MLPYLCFSSYQSSGANGKISPLTSAGELGRGWSQTSLWGGCGAEAGLWPRPLGH